MLGVSIGNVAVKLGDSAAPVSCGSGARSDIAQSSKFQFPLRNETN
jgi:hypothetical protein